MKNVLKVLLILAVVGLAYISYRSIMGPIEFAEVRSAREKEIVARLIDIRTAQIEYRNSHEGAYADDFDSLINFLKNAKMPIVLKQGELDDAQLERGLTEDKALEMIKKGNTNMWTGLDGEALTTSCKNNNWMHYGTSSQNMDEITWFLSPSAYPVDAYSVSVVYGGGMAGDYGAYAPLSVRPTLYLKSNIQIIDGDGSEGNAYKLSA